MPSPTPSQAEETAALEAARDDAARRLARERRVLEKQSRALLKVGELAAARWRARSLAAACLCEVYSLTARLWQPPAAAAD